MWRLPHGQRRRHVRRAAFEWSVAAAGTGLVEEQIRNPGKHSAETVMPGYDLNATEMRALVAYLLALP